MIIDNCSLLWLNCDTLRWSSFISGLAHRFGISFNLNTYPGLRSF